MNVLSLDPGFASVGYSIVELLSQGERVVAFGVIRTQKSVKKRHVLACEDNFARAREIALRLRSLAVTHDVRAICAEAMSFPRQASVAAKMAMCWGILADLTADRNLPLVQPTPQHVKKALCGKASASKIEVEAAVRARYCGLDLTGIPSGQQEHVFDSLAAVVASLDSEVLRALRQAVIPQPPTRRSMPAHCP